MNNWYRIDLGNEVDALAPTRKMQDAFMEVFLRTKPGSGRAMFSRYDLQADNVEVYFTPASANVAQTFGASPCSKPSPSRDRISLLCGESGDLALHFSEQSVNRR